MTKSASVVRNKKDQLSWHLMLLPGVLLTAVFAYLPMFGIVMAFQKFNPIKGFLKSQFVGFKNFKYIFNMPGFYDVLWNTIYIAALKIVAGIIVPLVLALLLNEVRRKYFARIIQTSVFLPYFLSWVILGGVIRQIFDLTGPINSIINALGGEPIMFLLNNNWFRGIIVASDVWKGMGYNMVLFLAAITGIDMAAYESAQIDGAGRFKQCWYITLPGMLPIIVLVSTLALGGLLNAGFDQIFMLYNPIVYETGDVIDTFVFRLGLVDRQYAPAAAMGLFKSVVSTFLVGISYFMAYKFSDHRIF
jgi:putative aldouronate transport system permease protein